MRTTSYRSGSSFAPIFPRRGRRWSWRARLLTAVLGVVAVPVATRASIAGFGDFSQFTVNQNDSGSPPTFPSPGTIELVNGTNESRSVFADTRQGVSQFTASFTYQVIHPGQDEGSAFVVQNDSQGVSAMGTGNHGFIGIQNSVEVVFNIGENQTALFTNGVGFNGLRGMSVDPVNFASGDPIDIRFTYAGTTLTETLSDEVTSAIFSTTYSIPIPANAGGSPAFVGLTAGSSTDSVDQLFSNFQFTSSVPEPSALAVMTAGIGWSLNRRRRV